MKNCNEESGYVSVIDKNFPSWEHVKKFIKKRPEVGFCGKRKKTEQRTERHSSAWSAMRSAQSGDEAAGCFRSPRLSRVHAEAYCAEVVL